MQLKAQIGTNWGKLAPLRGGFAPLQGVFAPLRVRYVTKCPQQAAFPSRIAA